LSSNPGLHVFSGLTQLSAEEARAEGALFSPTVQRILDYAIHSPDIANELYLHLIKQITDHPDPDRYFFVSELHVLFWGRGINSGS
jgi:hypothetical protein